ncbi:hypothetical protein, unlikely [Trypanosoma congolense IL3000]|uniref:Uncharacterized protein n=1 Tax=Trypanosoma congolense (strain IL3000) TaxID=1068625 RepID=F9W441_TRYCI|nr:hypothetical protein, unlikely [Trypanosoma congolense IL3000]
MTTVRPRGMGIPSIHTFLTRGGRYPGYRKRSTTRPTHHKRCRNSISSQPLRRARSIGPPTNTTEGERAKHSHVTEETTEQQGSPQNLRRRSSTSEGSATTRTSPDNISPWRTSSRSPLAFYLKNDRSSKSPPFPVALHP